MQVYRPHDTRLLLKQILVEPGVCVFDSRTRARPEKSDRTRLTKREREKSGPYCAAEGITRPARRPPYLFA